MEKHFAAYMQKNCIGFMIIFGKDERTKVEEIRCFLSDSVYTKYDEAETYHDGKWVMSEPTDTSEFSDYLSLLAIKRKPKRKQKPDKTEQAMLGRNAIHEV